MAEIYIWSLTAALNPSLLTAVTVMLLLDHPRRLLLGYLGGALLTSLSLGLLIVFALDGGSSATTSAGRTTVSPAINLTLGGLLLIIAWAIRPGRSAGIGAQLAQMRARRSASKAEKGPSRWQRDLSKGSTLTAFAVGIALSLPGASYLIGLHHIAIGGFSTAATVAIVISFNLIMLMLLELPLVGYVVAPEKTPVVVERFRNWFYSNSQMIAFRLAFGLGGLLILRGVIELV